MKTQTAYFCKTETVKRMKKEGKRGEMGLTGENYTQSAFALECYGLCQVQKYDKFR